MESNKSDLAVATEQWLASTCTVDEACDLIEALKVDKEWLQTEVDRQEKYPIKSSAGEQSGRHSC